MALPVVLNLQQCADYKTTLEPYLHQFATLPEIFFSAATKPASLTQLYLDTNPLVTAISFSLAIAPIFLVVSEFNKNYSQVDRVWSILPAIYNLHYAFHAHQARVHTSRLDAVLVLSTLWSVSKCKDVFVRYC
jgi:steroid 5-alpha reductase family enzyme